MITPSDLMAIAEHFAAMPGEPAGRAAVSRAYYSAFHVARQLIEQGCGIGLPGGPEVHKKLQFCLEQAGDAVLVEVADLLQTLRDQRNRADYQLADSKFAVPTNVRAQIESAKAIIGQIETASKRAHQFRAAARAYAGGVLKLRLKSLPS